MRRQRPLSRLFFLQQRHLRPEWKSRVVCHGRICRLRSGRRGLVPADRWFQYNELSADWPWWPLSIKRRHARDLRRRRTLEPRHIRRRQRKATLSIGSSCIADFSPGALMNAGCHERQRGCRLLDHRSRRIYRFRPLQFPGLDPYGGNDAHRSPQAKASAARARSTIRSIAKDRSTPIRFWCQTAGGHIS